LEDGAAGELEGLSAADRRVPSQPPRGKKPKKADSGQREMLMAIAGTGEGKAKPAAKETKRPAPSAEGGLMALFEYLKAR
jgi:hypothetical protein